MREPLSTHIFNQGVISALPLMDERARGSFAPGSRNQLYLGAGISRPWRGLESKGAGTGSRKMLLVNDTWGGIADIGGLQGSGSFFSDIGKSLWGIGSGQPNIAGVPLTGITLSTILQVSIAVNGAYSAGNSFSAGLPQSSAPDVAVLDNPGAGFTGLTDGPISIKIARLRLTTGARSIGSTTSAVIVPAKKSIRITFPLAATGQTHWRVFSTQEGFGGVGLHYALRYVSGATSVLDIPESVVAAGVVDGIPRSLEFDFKTGDLIPEIAYIYDYPPPAGTHAVRIENVMVVLGAFVDSVAAVSSTSTGTVGAVSLPNFYESYDPTHRIYFSGQIVDHRARLSDSYCYVAERNGISALQYVGLRDGPAIAVTTILPEIGIAKPHNWCQVAGLLYMRVANGGFIRMRPDGSFDYAWAAKIWDSIKNWDDSTVVTWHPDTMSVVIANGVEAWSYCLLNEEWSPTCYFADAGVAGTALSAINSRGELIITLSSGGVHTAYKWDAGAATMPITSITSWERSKARSARVREVMVAFENNRTADPLIISVHRNIQQRTYLRDAVVTNGSNTIESPVAPFRAMQEGEHVCVFGNGIGPGGINHLLGRIHYIAADEIQLIDNAGNPVLAGASGSGLYALLAHQITAYEFTEPGYQHSEFLDRFRTLDAQSYAIGFNMLTNADVGQITRAEVLGNWHGGRRAVTT